MFTCRVCQRQFKTSQALAGHVSGAHSHRQSDPPATQPGGEAQRGIMETGGEVEVKHPVQDNEPGTGEEIRLYLSLGYDLRELIEKLGFDPRSVRREIARMVPPASKTENGDSAMGLPVTVRGTEIITPESIMQRLANGSDDWHLRLEGMMLLRAAQKMNRDDIEMVRMQAEADAKLIEPVLKLMKETREEQDAAAARARDSSIEIAERTAFEVAQGMKGAFSAEMQSLRAALPGQPSETNPMAKMFFGAMQPHLGQMLGRVLSSFGKGQQPVAQPQGASETPGQPAQQAASDTPPPHVRPGEEGQWTEA